jgi:hypothetical protein
VVGERQEQPFQLSFNGSLRVDFQGARVTSDGGLLLVRELDERLAFGELIEQHLTDGRGKNTQLPLTDLVRQSIYSRLAGYEDVNDAERPLPRPDLSADRLREGLGPRSGVDLALAVIRDRTADASRKPGGTGRAQSGAGRQGGSHRFTAVGSAGHGQQCARQSLGEEDGMT